MMRVQAAPRGATAAGEFDHRLGVGCSRHRHVRRIQRARGGDNVFSLPIFAVPVEWFLRGPALQNEIERFPQTRMAVFVGEPAFVGEKWIGKSRPKAEEEAAAAHHMTR